MLPKSGSQVSTRARILGVAKTLFAARGYEHSSTSALARTAGTSESQLMKYFGSKSGLLDAIFSEAFESITTEASRAIIDVQDPLEKLRVVTAVVLHCIERDPELKVLMLLEGRRIRKEGQLVSIVPSFLEFVRLVDGILDEMRAAGELRSGLNTQAVRSALIGLMEGLLRDRFLAERLEFPADYATADMQQILSLTLDCFTKKP